MARNGRAKDIDRRALLKALGAGGMMFNPVSAFVSGLVGGAAMSAQAQSGGTPRKYVFVYLESGPPRWHFDQTMVPVVGGMPFVPNGGMNNSFNEAGQPVYIEIPIEAGGKKYMMPPLWGCELPRPDGSRVPMSALFANTAIMRGYDMLADGHVGNRIKQIYPLTGAGSLNGLVADNSSVPLPAVSLTPGIMSEAFFSNKGIGQLIWNPENQERNALQQFLDPFQYEAATRDSAYFQKRGALEATIEKALARIQKATEGRMPGTSGMFRDRSSARKLLKTDLGDLTAIYQSLAGKYAGIIAACRALDIPRITAAPIAGGNLSPNHKKVMIPSNVAGVPVDNGDLREILYEDTSVTQMAEGFAVAEFMLTRNYGAAVMINAANPIVRANFGGQLQAFPYTLDDHNNGTAISTVLFSFYYRAIAACIYELSTVLKTADLWNETVVHIASEFSRSPRSDGTGSDHGFEANVTTLMSGAIKAPLVVGDIRIDNSQGNQALPIYGGTWGAAAPVNHDNTTGHINIGHVSSSVADLLRVDRPMRNFAPVLDVGKDGVKSKIGDPKNV